MPTSWDGHGGSNTGVAPAQRTKLPRGLSSLDVIVQGGFLPMGSGPVEYAAWLREPLTAIIADLNTHIDSRFTLLWAPFVSDMNDLVTDAQGHATAAQTAETNAETAQAAAEAAQAAAEAAAALVVGGVLASGFISGLYVSPNGANPTTRIDITAGQARSSDNTTDIVLAAPITKRLDAVWAEGTGNGGRDVATALAAGQSWFVHVIWHPNGGTPKVDAVLSLSPTAPTLPSGWTKSAFVFPLPNLGAESFPASGTAIPFFVQNGNYVQLKTPSKGYSGQTGNASPQLKDFGGTSGPVPVGLKIDAELYVQANYDGTTTLLVFKDPDLGVPSAFGGDDQYSHVRLSTNERYLTAVIRVPTNTAGRIYAHISQAGATWAAKVLGYRFQRGLQ